MKNEIHYQKKTTGKATKHTQLFYLTHVLERKKRESYQNSIRKKFPTRQKEDANI